MEANFVTHKSPRLSLLERIAWLAGKTCGRLGKKSDPGGHGDHNALGSRDMKHPGFRLYNAVRNALQKVDKKYAPAFEEGGKKKQ